MGHPALTSGTSVANLYSRFVSEAIGARSVDGGRAVDVSGLARSESSGRRLSSRPASNSPQRAGPGRPRGSETPSQTGTAITAAELARPGAVPAERPVSDLLLEIAEGGEPCEGANCPDLDALPRPGSLSRPLDPMPQLLLQIAAMTEEQNSATDAPFSCQNGRCLPEILHTLARDGEGCVGGQCVTVELPQCEGGSCAAAAEKLAAAGPCHGEDCLPQLLLRMAAMNDTTLAQAVQAVEPVDVRSEATTQTSVAEAETVTVPSTTTEAARPTTTERVASATKATTEPPTTEVAATARPRRPSRPRRPTQAPAATGRSTTAAPATRPTGRGEAVVKLPLDDSSNSCLRANGGCSHVCSSDISGVVHCSCPEQMRLQPDGEWRAGTERPGRAREWSRQELVCFMGG